jgi:hypothetical protein
MTCEIGRQLDRQESSEKQRRKRERGRKRFNFAKTRKCFIEKKKKKKTQHSGRLIAHEILAEVRHELCSFIPTRKAHNCTFDRRNTR